MVKKRSEGVITGGVAVGNSEPERGLDLKEKKRL